MTQCVLLAALALGGALPHAAAAAGGDAAALLAKHHAYVGWATGDGSVRTLRATGEITYDGKPRSTLTSLRYGSAFRDTVVSSSGLQSDKGFTGHAVWTSNANGFTVRAIGDFVRAEFAVDALFGETTATPEFAREVVRTAKVDGVDCEVVRLTSPVTVPIEVSIDPATGAFRRAVIDPDGAYETPFDGLEYTLVDGKRFLSAWHHGASKTRYRYTGIVPNAPVTADDLRPPKQTATWTFGEAPATIEYVDHHGPRIYVDLLVNGVKGKFILDTGAANTVVVDSFARRAGAKRFGEGTISGFGGTVKANLFRAATISVGGSTLHDVIIRSGLDEQDWAREEVVGLVGFDLLAATITELNLDTKTLKVSDPAKVEADKSAGIVVNIDLSERHPRAQMRVDDRYDVMATFDSGSPSDILFSRDLVKRNHVDFKSLGTATIGGVAGIEYVECGKLKPVALGPVRYEARWACAMDSFARNEILVGLDFMRAFNFVFAYPDGVMVMTPRKHY